MALSLWRFKIYFVTTDNALNMFISAIFVTVIVLSAKFNCLLQLEYSVISCGQMNFIHYPVIPYG
jgi:hypothetical protein